MQIFDKYFSILNEFLLDHSRLSQPHILISFDELLILLLIKFFSLFTSYAY